MSIVKALFDQSVISTDECFGQPDVTSQEMRDAINAWRNTYLKREGDKASDPCMRMAYVIVHKLQKGVFAEYSSDILDKEKTAKGKWMDRNLSQLDLIRDSILQWMLIGGECWVKPVPRPGPDGSTIFAPLLVHRTDAVILAREPDGRVTSIVTAEHTARGSQYYTLLERRTVDANGYLTIENNPIVKMYTDGSSVRQYPFAVWYRGSRGTIQEGIVASGKCELISRWLERQSRDGMLPDLPEGMAAQLIQASDTGKLYTLEPDVYIYEVPCRLQYIQEA